jgi:hypothetical protein
MLLGDCFPQSSLRVEEIRSTVSFDKLLIITEAIMHSATKLSAPRPILFLRVLSA